MIGQPTLDCHDPAPRLDLLLLAASQAQKHVTHNEALMALDAIVLLSLKSRAELTPPADPEHQASYFVPDGSGGGFLGQDGWIATYNEGQWLFRTPWRRQRCLAAKLPATA